MDIKKLKSSEIQDIRDFLDGLDDYGHVYYFPPEDLDEPFRKILEGIQEVQKLMKESWSM